MKHKNICTAIGLMLALGFSGCAKDPEGIDQKQAKGKQVDVVITSTPFTDKATRTAYENYEGTHRTVWVKNEDVLGVFASASGTGSIGTNSKFIISDVGATGAASFSGTLTDPAEGAAFNATYHAYYPWQDIADANPAALKWTLPATQYPTAETFDGAADLLLGAPVETTAPVGQMSLSGANVPVNFIFTRPLAITRLGFSDVPATVAGQAVKRVIFKTTGTAIAGETSIDLTAAAPTFAMGSGATDEITLSIKGEQLTADFAAWIMMPAVSAASFDLTIETASHIIKRTVNAPDEAFEFKANNLNTLVITLATAEITAKTVNAPKAEWIDVVMTKDGAVNLASSTLPLVAASNGGPATSYDPTIKMWTSYHPGTDDAGTGISGTNSYTTKNYYRLPYGGNTDFKTAIQAEFTMEVYCKSLDDKDRSPFSGMEGGGFGFRSEGTGPQQAHMGYLNAAGTGNQGYRKLKYAEINSTDYFHYLFTYDGSTLTAYCNGESVASFDNPGTPSFPGSAANHEFTLGGDTNNTTRAQLVFYGNIAFARVHGEALTAAQVEDTYAQIAIRSSIEKFDDLNTALVTTIQAMSDSAEKDALLEEGWGLMNDIATTEAEITAFLAKVDEYEEVVNAPKADWVDVMFTADGAVNTAELGIAYSLFPIAGSTPPVTSYDSDIKFWAGNFDGTSSTSFFQIPYNGKQPFMTAVEKNFSMEIFCKTLDNADRVPAGSMLRHGWGFRRDGENNTLNAKVYSSDAGTSLSYPETNNTDYYHYSVTYDKTNIVTYLNGIETGRIPCSGDIWMPNTAIGKTFTIGGDINSDGITCRLPFYGNIAFVRIHDNVLTADEIALLYAQIEARQAIDKFDDLAAAIQTTIPALPVSLGRNELMEEAWILMNDISTTASKINTFLAKVNAIHVDELLIEWSNHAAYNDGAADVEKLVFGPDIRTETAIAGVYGTTAWTVDNPAEDWITLTKDGNSVKMTLSEYEGATSRSVTLTLTNTLDSSKKTITLEQIAQISNKSEWTIEAGNANTTAYSGNPFGNLIDGNTGTYWEYNWSGTGSELSAFPYQFVIDMKIPQFVNTFGPSQAIAGGTIKNNTTIKDVKYEISEDGENWADFGEFLMSESLAVSQAYGMKPYVHSQSDNRVVYCRYVRFTLLTSGYSPTAPNAGLGELDIYIK